MKEDGFWEWFPVRLGESCVGLDGKRINAKGAEAQRRRLVVEHTLALDQ